MGRRYVHEIHSGKSLTVGVKPTMKDRNVTSRFALGAAGIIMVVTAGLHAVGYIPLTRELAGSNLGSFWLAGVKGLWLVFSMHLVIVGVLFIAAAIAPWVAGRLVLSIAGLVPAGDTLMLLAFVGVFIGTIFLGVAAVLVYVGVALRSDVVTQSGGT
jgi:hypothetical protein